MKRVPIDSDYVESLHRFTKLIQYQKNDDAGQNVYTVFPQTGRKYDKIMQMKNDGAPELLFFVERKTKFIYGKKNEIQPNLFWFFNSLSTAHLWNWRGFPKPINDPSVKVVLEYGDTIKHYKLKTEAELAQEEHEAVKAPTKQHQPLDMAKTKG